MDTQQLYEELPHWRAKNYITIDTIKGCWIWQGRKDQDGYASATTKKVPGTTRGHRITYTLLVGTIPEGLTLDHECEVRNCVNPAHLTPCSAVENIKRGAARRSLRLWEGPQATKAQLARARGICPNGHVLAEVGTLERSPGGVQRCKACQHETQRKNRLKNGIKVGKPRGAYGKREPAPKSGHKGVSWVRSTGKWKVAVYYKGKNYYGESYAPEDLDKAVAEKDELVYLLERGHTTL